MKKLFFVLPLCFFAFFAHAQEEAMDLPSEITFVAEQEPYQQLIGYALEVKNALIDQEKTFGKYKCEDVFSTDGYNTVGNYPCEAIVHSSTGPIVVRYKNVEESVNTDISEFLKKNPLKDPTYFNNGRFRFSLD